MPNSRSMALMIGLDVYQSHPRLAGAYRNADAMASLLRWTYKFEVSTLLNAQATRGAVTREVDRMQAADRLLIYYAGRALGEDSLALFNTDAAIPNSGLSLERLIRQLDSFPTSQVMIVLEAALPMPPYLEPLSSDQIRPGERARLVLCSGPNAWQSRERWGDDDATLFTAQVIHGLRGSASDENGAITGNLLAAYVQVELPKTARGQLVPWAGRLAGCGGDWVFREVAPLELPIEITDGLRSGFPSVRYRAVAQLSFLIDKGDPVVASLALEKLREVAGDNDSVNVRKMAEDELYIRHLSATALDVPVLREPPPPQQGSPEPRVSNAAEPPMPGDKRQTYIVIGVMIAVLATVVFLVLHYS